MPRRGENIYKRKDGRWEGRILVRGNGTSKYRSVYAPSYKELKEKMEAFRKSGFSENNGDKNTFGYFARLWLQTVKLRCKRSTCARYYNICKCHIMPALGEIRFANLSNDDINALLSRKTQLAPKTQSDILGVVKMICSYAESRGCKGNICLKTISVRVPKKQPRVLTAKEQIALFEYLSDNIDKLKLGTYLAFCTGIRIGELCALRRENISFDRKSLHIGATMLRVQNHEGNPKTSVIVTEPKSACSVRDIPLTEPVLSILSSFCSSMPGDAFILSGSPDKFVEPGRVRYHFNKYLKDCGIEGATFHTLRHTFATRCVEAGMDIKTLSELLGHENVNITLNRYVHSSWEFKRESMERMCVFSSRSPLYEHGLAD